MNLYFAPLEGITTSIYRNTHVAIFGGCHAYYAPFITPSDNEKVSRKGLREVLPNKNQGQALKVQVLTNHAVSFLRFVKKIKTIGYEEVNINLGCPFERVVRKGRGAGFLLQPDLLDQFLYDVFASADIKISIKTRTGYASSEELERLLEIFNQYPLTQLTIHPRTREDFYKGAPDMEAFAVAYAASANPICYNGDITSWEDYQRIVSQFPALEGVMIGRGAVSNPALFREIQGGESVKTEELVLFTEKLTENYYDVLQSEIFTLHKLKEVWAYMMQNFPNEKKIAKAICKASTIQDLQQAVKSLPVLS